jgi:hypothetical protein
MCGAGLAYTDRTAGADSEGLLFFVAVRFLFFVADTGETIKSNAVFFS